MLQFEKEKTKKKNLFKTCTEMQFNIQCILGRIRCIQIGMLTDIRWTS